MHLVIVVGSSKVLDMQEFSQIFNWDLRHLAHSAKQAFCVRNPSESLQRKKRQIGRFENEFQHFENEFHYFWEQFS